MPSGRLRASRIAVLRLATGILYKRTVRVEYRLVVSIKLISTILEIFKRTEIENPIIVQEQYGELCKIRIVG